MAISILSVINWLSPKDAGSRLVAGDIAYGRDPRQKLDVYAPVGGGGARPVVVFIYGGSWSDGDRGNYAFAARAIAALGYVTVVPDYRLLPAVEYPRFLEDCAEAVAWVAANIKDLGGAADRIALMGHSAGAYNAMMLALDARYRRQWPVLGALAGVVGLSGPYDFFPFDGPISLRTFGAVRQPLLTQPIAHVSGNAPGIFLASGDRDRLVYPRNSVALARQLRQHGVAVEEKHYPRLGHAGPLLALGRPARLVAPVLADVGRFLRQRLY